MQPFACDALAPTLPLNWIASMTFMRGLAMRSEAQ